MRAVLQRARGARVRVGDEVVGEIERGLLVLVGVAADDDASRAHALADKIRALRIFEDERGKMNLDVLQAQGAVLLVSQFTLSADVSRGRRPSFSTAAPPERARALIGEVATALRERGLVVEEGRFGASMQVELVNEGPVTFVLDV